MQTFLPDPSFRETFRVLDPARRRNQINETVVIMRAVTVKDPIEIPPYAHHPATMMWYGFADALMDYYRANVLAEDRVDLSGYFMHPPHIDYPPMIGDQEFHLSHRRMLLHKPGYFEYYARVWPQLAEYDACLLTKPTYFWPIRRRRGVLYFASQRYADVYQTRFPDWYMDTVQGIQIGLEDL